MKDKTILDYTIIIKRVRSMEGNKNNITYTDKLFLVDAWNGEPNKSSGTLFSVPIGKNFGASLRKVFLEIQKQLYIK